MAYYYTPFRKGYSKDTNSSLCPFCDKKKMKDQCVARSDGSLVENEFYRWVINMYPKFEGHTMVVPKKHILDLGEEPPESVCAREEMTIFASETLKKLYPGAGIEVFLQTSGESASSVAHIHWHVVPAQKDDNLRSFEKLGHFYTIEPDEEKVIIFPHKIDKAGEILRDALRKLIE